MECLEPRRVLTSFAGDTGPEPHSEQVHAEVSSFDVNRDGHVTPIDALQVINEIDRRRESAGHGESTRSDSPASHPTDVNGDGFVDKGDFELVLAALSEPATPPVSEANTWHHQELPLDVDLDGSITALDALAISNELARRSVTDANGRPLRDRHENEPYLDVNNDRLVNATDFDAVLQAVHTGFDLRAEPESQSTFEFDDSLESTLDAIHQDIAGQWY